jgi:hypothetical protein
MGECAGVKSPQPGEWWQFSDDEYPKGFRLFIVGRKLNGSLMCQNSSGAADIYTVSGDEWRHLPDCTGFDWVEETYPQWIIRKPPCTFHNGGYVLRKSKTEGAHFLQDGSKKDFEWGADSQLHVNEGAWLVVTQAEAEATVKKPEEIEHERAKRDAELACETGRMDPSAAFNYMRATENSSREIDAAGQDVPKKRKEDVLFHEVVIFRLGGRQLTWMENPGGMETTGNVRHVPIEVRNDREA